MLLLWGLSVENCHGTTEILQIDSQSWFATVRQSQIIAVIRTAQFDLGLPMARAVFQGGIRVVEITWNSDRASDLVCQIRDELPDCMVGAGTLLTLEQQQQAIAAGSQFLFTPHVDLTLIQSAIAQNIPIVAGALTPTEIVRAWQAGASCIKVFPIQAVGGAAYIQHLQGPLGEIPLIPSGGVTLSNAPEFLQAGAIAVGISGSLFPHQAVQSGNWGEITTRAANLMASIRESSR